MNIDATALLNEWSNGTDQIGITADNNLSEGIFANKEVVVEAAGDVAKAAITKIYEKEPEFYLAGKYCAQGFADGIKDDDADNKVFNNVAELVLDARNKLAATAVINSPSKMFAKLGEFCTLGFADGILSLAGFAEDATEDVGNDAIDAMKAIISRIYDKAIEGLDTNPRITPVLDLTELEEGIYQANNLLSNNGFVMGSRAAAGFNRGLSMKYAQENQNGYDDSNVVEAITSLRNEVNNLNGSLETLGFYVDGKQVATAIADPMQTALNKIAVSTGRGVRK